jgi:hypothetical protein
LDAIVVAWEARADSTVALAESVKFLA